VAVGMTFLISGICSGLSTELVDADIAAGDTTAGDTTAAPGVDPGAA